MACRICRYSTVGGSKAVSKVSPAGAIGADGGAADADARSLYDKLEQVVLPLYCSANDGPGWVKVMKGAIHKNASYFNSHRMMRRYVTEAYIR